MSSNDYAARQTAKDAAYARELAALTEQGALSRGVVKALRTKRPDGKLGPVSVSAAYQGNGQEHDISDMPIGMAVDIAALIDQMEDKLAEIHARGGWKSLARYVAGRIEIEAQQRQAERFARLIGPLVTAKNSRLEVVALAFASNTAQICGFTTQSAAAQTIMGSDGKPITKACLNKRVNQYISYLGLPPAPGMRKKAAVISYQKARKTTHWRKTRETTGKDALMARMAKLN